ncbi:MAG: BatD family protein [Burkholderiales bacterium]
MNDPKLTSFAPPEGSVSGFGRPGATDMSKQRTSINRSRSWPLAILRMAALSVALLGASTGVWADVSASLDRDSVALGQPLTLTIQSDGKSSDAQPDLSPLRKDFEVLGTSKSSEIRIINFHRSDSVRWTIQLLPRRAGSIELPPLSVGAEQTAALTLDVGQPAAAPGTAGAASANGQNSSPAAFMEIDSAAAGKPIYVQQQVPYTVRLYVDGSVRSGDLRAPTSPDAVIEQLGDEQRSTATVHGRDYTVIERHYAISPEKSGTLRIEPASFRGQAVAPQDAAQGADPGDDLMAQMLRNTPFANNPIFRNRLPGGFSMGAALRPVGASAQPLALDVRPRPAAAQGQWLPAEQIQLHDSWADAAPTFKAGEPVTRTLTIEAKGLAASQIPPLALAAPANARIYPDAPDNHSRTDGTTIYGTSKQTVTYIPNAAGELEVAPVDLAWWDTHDNMQRHGELPARSFHVEQGAPPTAAGATPAPSVAGATTTSVAGIHAAATPPSATTAPWYFGATETARSHWVWVSAGLAMLLAGVLAWWLTRRRTVPAATPHDFALEPPAARASLRNLRAACRAGNSEDAARALLDLACAEWPERAPRGLGELAQRLDAGADEVRALDRSLYGGSSGAWDGMALWRALGNGLRPPRVQTSTSPPHDGLAPLYL